jgi:hypothetical protein
MIKLTPASLAYYYGYRIGHGYKPRHSNFARNITTKITDTNKLTIYIIETNKKFVFPYHGARLCWRIRYIEQYNDQNK